MKIKSTTTTTEKNPFFRKEKTSYSYKKSTFSRPIRSEYESTRLTNLGKVGTAAGAAGAVIGLISAVYGLSKTIAADIKAAKASKEALAAEEVSED